MAAESTATTVWEGGLADGKGTTSSGSGAVPDLGVTWSARIGERTGQTTPEELLAMAHASCYCMALSHGLGEAGTPPERLEAKATVAFVPGEGVKSSHLVISGRVPGIDADGFSQAADDAGKNCPVSQALAGIEITVEATLEN